VNVRNPARSMVPSPSDIAVELTGEVQVGAGAWGGLRSRGAWIPVERDAIPEALIDLLPAGALLTSPDLNESFAENPVLAHGFLAIVEGVEGLVYVVAADMDHPLR
jgi:hypothetical protein